VQISVIATVKNESGSIARLLESLCAQTRPPDEVVIVDGGSMDGTLEQLRIWEQNQRLPLRVLVESGCNISRGRNTAIRAAQYPIMASTDAGVRAEPSWLANLTMPFVVDTAQIPPIVACGFFVPETTTPFETAMGATVLPTLTEVKPERFLPSSRSVAFPKSAWEAVGGYPEWLDYCEDLILDFRLRAQGYRFVFVPDAIVHFRPRGSLCAFFRQYFRYARGDGKADLWRKRHAARYLAYGVALPVLLWLAIPPRGGTAYLSHSALWVVPLLLGALAMFWTPYKRLLPALRVLTARERLEAILWVPLIRVTGDLAKMLGYPVGLFWRRLHRLEIPRWRD
jgi:cellulose synthase/poly-beta-1,6-N-acetylglucosamine synthase-like glycosyltransferase